MLKLKQFVVCVAVFLLTTPVALANNPVVSVVPVKKDILAPTVMVTGQVHSRFQSDVSAGISGKLVWIAEPGAEVKANEVIARLEQRPYQLEVHQLEAKIERKNIELNTAERNLKRMQKLLAEQATSRREIEQQQDNVALAHADLRLLKLQLEEAHDNLRRTEVKAPFAGVITNRMHQEGADVAPTQALVQLVDLSHLEIRFHGPLSYSDFTAMQSMLHVYHSGGAQKLELRSLIPVSDIRSQTFTGLLSIPQQSSVTYRVGELVTVAVPTAAPKERFIVPRDAVVYTVEGAHIFVVDTDGQAVKVPVKLAEGHLSHIAVEGALAVGQRVVVRGAETLRDGQIVQVLTSKEFPLAS